MLSTDADRFRFVRENYLYVAVVCDVLDSLGYRHQVMHQRLRPLLPDRHNCGFLGRARTFRWMQVDYIVREIHTGWRSRQWTRCGRAMWSCIRPITRAATPPGAS